ncbi:3-phosphoinositide-dependent protein kinase 1 [Lingula anatina]|uniref:3-phosphoinositide-dependent protein kinase 1 n=1 Tax=Lingula anatina TaxID=7574 RepID=A0A1S3HLQ6_LINAN|nr:3-phosphoinositide-dependent protein kinase 1 [Lingula anatina]|eukprot:XP_013385959.1 3-phosphoinositide-dependent protein kinase 1 [Lingula anatina]
MSETQRKSPSSQEPSSPVPQGERSDGQGTDNKMSKRSSMKQMKKKPEDFLFGKVIGEGSYSTVFLVKEVSTGKEYAMKVLEKRFIIKEHKTEYVHREKEVFAMINHPFFVRMYFTFQDMDRLYFCLSYARRGELFEYLNKMGSFSLEQTRFYTAEIVSALEHLHGKGIIHRDLKPENILFGDNMHIQITDFGSAKIIKREVQNNTNEDSNAGRRRNSFVGTAQYVSPEVLTSKTTYCSSDLWALGCIIYQLLGGLTPFRGRHEYEIFQKIVKVDYAFPEGFDPDARDLVDKLIQLDPTKRIGCEEEGGYGPLKTHSFLKGIKWDDLINQKPPLEPLNKNRDNDNLYKDLKPGYDEMHISQLLCKVEVDDKTDCMHEESFDNMMTEQEHSELIEKQKRENIYHKFVENHLVLKQGLVDKKRGLFSRRRMMLLTEGPHLYYVDPVNMVLKGQIPWSRELRPEAKNFHIFYVHTPKRTYYLDDPDGYALEWVKSIQEVWDRYFGTPKVVKK